MPRTVLITGCSSGIGRATALLFQKKGWNVAATMRAPEKEPELGSLDGVRIFALDVTDPRSVGQAVNGAMEAFGGLDVVVNNAGYGVFGPFQGASPEQIRKVFETNLFGLMEVTRAVIPHLRADGGGALVNVSSMAGLYSLPMISIYAATKFAVEGFTECLYYELDSLGVRVKLVEPGNVETGFVWDPAPLGALQPADRDHYGRQIQTVLEFWARPANTKGRATATEVAMAIYKAATDETRQLRYIVGADANGFWNQRIKLGNQGFVEELQQDVFGQNAPY